MLSNFRVHTWLVTQRASDDVNMRGGPVSGAATAGGAPAISIAKDHVRTLTLARLTLSSMLRRLYVRKE
jgi:hypothetical protein